MQTPSTRPTKAPTTSPTPQTQAPTPSPTGWPTLAPTVRYPVITVLSSAIRTGNNSYMVDTSDKLQLQGSMFGGTLTGQTYAWSTPNASAASLIPSASFYLVTPPGSLRPGGSYAFTFTIAGLKPARVCRIMTALIPTT
jgi:hypothetical protein